MNKLPQVFMIMTVLALGVMYGHYNYSLEQGTIPDDRGFVSHMASTVRNLGNKKSPPAGLKPDESAQRQQKDNVARGSRPNSEDAIRKQDSPHEIKKTDKKPAHEKPVKKPPYQDKLDEVDTLTTVASAYYRLCMVTTENRELYTGKVIECTDKALDILEPLSRKYPDRPEIEDRMQEIYRLRHGAVKQAPAAGKKDK